ncbi:hypothetical protein AKJ66_03345 [candidate division MSBL1 archaeon SCGC-AAA259E22]|uniref:Response regulatory domain-containing protein n=1 Tax=candidate division MSBL1 archaeon SCGC-AAA259E22 TaxID=1698265 RepID=A0A133UFE4_9EURY|nr:hypothetical protein AKJ66_03345 [candidate division MSBL1 archaeon SCGC-AAA259E22]
MEGRIMVVDDVPGVLKLTKRVLESEGFQVITADSGQKALKKLRKKEVDLALIDVFMPKMDGRELIEKIRDDPSLKDLRIALLTIAKSWEVEKDKLEELGVQDFIQKPFDNKDLIQRVRNLLN